MKKTCNLKRHMCDIRKDDLGYKVTSLLTNSSHTLTLSFKSA